MPLSTTLACLYSEHPSACALPKHTYLRDRTQNKACKACLQCQAGVSLQPISRFQAVAVGDVIYIHTHRSLQDILALNVKKPERPELQLQPVSSTNGAAPAARYTLSFT